jgi:hypothetical protein
MDSFWVSFFGAIFPWEQLQNASTFPVHFASVTIQLNAIWEVVTLLFYSRSLYCKTTTIMEHSPKLEIQQSLEAMDQTQMDLVLQYIHGLLRPRILRHPSLKREAMKEIRQALRMEKKIQAHA